MPNTLAHIFVQGLTSRAIINNASFLWVCFAVVIPDLPWIIQRVVQILGPDINPFAMRQYAIVQASLFSCVLLSAALSALSREKLKTFTILSLGSLIHLLLDASQIKWANGVHLLAPFNWDLLNFGFYWPESFPTYILTFLGFAYFLYMLRSGIRLPPVLSLAAKNLIFAVCLLMAYFLFPFGLIDKPYEADNHFLKTLAEKQMRTGKTFEVDRDPVLINNEQVYLQIFTGEKILLKGVNIDTPGIFSIRGKFSTPDSIVVEDSHRHVSGLRDLASYIGLLLIFMLLVVNLISHDTRKKSPVNHG